MKEFTQLNRAQLTLQSRDVTLIPLQVSYAKELWPFMNDPRTSKYLAWQPHPDVDFSQNIFSQLEDANKQNRSFHWIISFSDSSVGLISIIDIRRRHLSWTIDRGELAYWVAAKFQNHGIATTASKLVMDLAYSQLKFHKLVVAHAEENTASRRVIEKLGFNFYGIEEDAFKKNERWYSLRHYQKINPAKVVNND